MKGAVCWCSALTVALCATAGTARGAGTDVTDGDRVWANFTREAAVVGDRRIWVELRGMKLEDDQGGPTLGLNGYPVNDFEKAKGKTVNDIDGGRFDLVGAYGLGASAELGMDLPFVMQEQITFDPLPDQTNETFQESVDVGDLVFYGKFKRELAEHWAGAIGLEMSIPTGSEAKMLGSGELGLNPFLSTRYQSGRVGIGGHVGFLLNTDHQPQVFNWSVEGIARGTDMFALRVEVSGRLFRDVGELFNDIAVYPGIDFNLTENFIIRPQALAHLTDDAIDWGLGLGLVFII